MNTTFTVLKP